MKKILFGLLAVLMVGVMIVTGCTTTSSSTPTSSTQPPPPSSSSTLPPPPTSSTLPPPPTSSAPPPPPPTSTSAPPKTLKIGALYDLSGDMSTAGILFNQGSTLCQDWINDNGGITIAGQKYNISLDVQDTKSNADGAVTAATVLVSQDNVKFVIGPIRPDMDLASQSVTEPAKVINAICFGSGAKIILGTDKPYSFMPVISGAVFVPTLYDYLKEAYPNVKTIALTETDEPGGQFAMEISKAQAASHGLTITSSEFHIPGSIDYNAMLTKMLATHPDALDLGLGNPLEASQLLKQARDLGFTGPAFGCSPVSMYTITGIAGPDYAYDYFNISYDPANPADATPMMTELMNRWKAKYPNDQFQFESFQGWDCVWTIVQAIQAANSLDPTAVAKAWENMSSIQEVYGTGHMGGLKTFGINHVVVRQNPICSVDHGKVNFIKWVTPDIP